MQIVLAILGFMAFMCLIELGIYIFYAITAKVQKTSVPPRDQRTDASTVLIFAIIGAVAITLIGQLYIKLGGS